MENPMVKLVFDSTILAVTRKLPAERNQKPCFSAIPLECGQPPNFGLHIQNSHQILHLFTFFENFYHFSTEVYSEVPVFTEKHVGTRTAQNKSGTGKTGTRFGNFRVFPYVVWRSVVCIFDFQNTLSDSNPFARLDCLFWRLELLATLKFSELLSRARSLLYLLHPART